jgi:Xaa-Pro aminopeptidase
VRRAPTDAPFVHAGCAGDPTLRWLVDAPLPPERCGYVCVDDEPTLLAPPGVAVAVADVERHDDPTVGVAESLPAETVRAPRHLPHDVALRVERAGSDLRSTAAVEDARARKDSRERAELRAAAAAADAGIDRAREALAEPTGGRTESEAADGHDPSERLRRVVAGAVATAGATPRVRVDGAPEPGVPVVVDAGARVGGYHARTCRTLVAVGDAGAARRAHVACESALRVAADEAAPGTDVDWLASEVRAELGSFGVQPTDATPVVGTGLARREAPWVGSDASLSVGHALVVTAGARVPDAGAVVRLADTLVVGPEDPERLSGAETASRR